jgi:hypothetical protein
MRVTEFVTLDFPVARYQAVINYPGLLLPCQIAFLSGTSLAGLRLCCHLISELRARLLNTVRLNCNFSKRVRHFVLSTLQKRITRVDYETFVMFEKRRRTNAHSRS